MTTNGSSIFFIKILICNLAKYRILFLITKNNFFWSIFNNNIFVDSRNSGHQIWQKWKLKVPCTQGGGKCGAKCPPLYTVEFIISKVYYVGFTKRSIYIPIWKKKKTRQLGLKHFFIRPSPPPPCRTGRCLGTSTGMWSSSSPGCCPKETHQNVANMLLQASQR